MTMTITAASHPLLFAACEAISHDNGSGAGWPSHTMPGGDLGAAEAALATLTAEERETLAIGEISEQDAISARSSGLAEAARLLLGFWEDHLP